MAVPDDVAAHLPALPGGHGGETLVLPSEREVLQHVELSGGPGIVAAETLRVHPLASERPVVPLETVPLSVAWATPPSEMPGPTSPRSEWARTRSDMAPSASQGRDPTIGELRALAALREHRHFGRAAASLGINQSTLTRRIKELEQRIGLELVTRTTRSLRFTTSGDVVAAAAVRVLTVLDAEIEHARLAARQHLPTRVGITWPGFSAVPMAAARRVSEFRPGAVLQFTSGPTSDLVEQLRTAALDVVFARTPGDFEGLASLPLETEACAVALPAGHPQAALDVVPAGCLGAGEIVLFERRQSPEIWDHVVRSLFGAGEPRIVYTAPTELEVIAAVPVFRVSGIVTASVAAATSAADVVFRPITPPLELGLALLWRPDQADAPGVAEIRRAVEPG